MLLVFLGKILFQAYKRRQQQTCIGKFTSYLQFAYHGTLISPSLPSTTAEYLPNP